MKTSASVQLYFGSIVGCWDISPAFLEQGLAEKIVVWAHTVIKTSRRLDSFLLEVA
jgi:hypothetical protein